MINQLKQELKEKGAPLLIIEALALIACIGMAWGSLFVIDAYYQYQLGAGF